MKKFLAAALISTLIATPVFAEDFISSAPSTPIYAGLQFGDATTFLGGYQIDKMFAAELNYSKYNEFASSIGVFGSATFPLTLKGAPPFSLYGKLGVVRTTVEVPPVCIFGICTQSLTSSSTDLAFGGGAQYDFNKRFSARLGLDIGKYKSSNLYIGGIMKF